MKETPMSWTFVPDTRDRTTGRGEAKHKIRGMVIASEKVTDGRTVRTATVDDIREAFGEDVVLDRFWYGEDLKNRAAANRLDQSGMSQTDKAMAVLHELKRGGETELLIELVGNNPMLAKEYDKRHPDDDAPYEYPAGKPTPIERD
jgi:hypothetical protein